MNGHILPRTSIAVDFWAIHGSQRRYIHFLSHVHGDHIVGLTSTWTQPIYCSEMTADILHLHYGLSRSLLHPLPVNQATIIPMPHSAKTFCVTAFDANHCPGALMFYFQGDFGNIFYTADFRYSPETMASHLKTVHGKTDVLYLDNTFCSPKCNFPSRDECLSQIKDVIKEHPDHSVVIGIRKLGKEDMLVDLGVTLDETIYVSPERLKIIQLLFSTNVFAPLCDVKGQNGRIKTIPFHQVSSSLLHKLNETTPTIAILPSAVFTGLPTKPFSRNPHIYVIPYSDHSSYPELMEFVSHIKPSQIVPIVNSKRGPFGADIGDRLDMSCFNQFLNSSSPAENPTNFEEYIDRKSIEGVTKVRTFTVSSVKGEDGTDVSASLRDYSEPVIRSFKSFCPVNDSTQQDWSSLSQLKRKRSSRPLCKKRRKTAKGIHYIDDLSEDQDQNGYVKKGKTDENICSTSCGQSDSELDFSGLESAKEGSESEAVAFTEDNKELSKHLSQSDERVDFKNQTIPRTISHFDTDTYEAERANPSFTGSEVIHNYANHEKTPNELNPNVYESSNHFISNTDESFERHRTESIFCDALGRKSAGKPDQTILNDSFQKILCKKKYGNERKGKSNKCIISTLKSLIEKWENKVQ